MLERPTLPPEIAQQTQRVWNVKEAYAFCTDLTRSHYENFPVGSLLVPSHIQPAIHSLYAFMRTADDFSDEDRKAGDEEERLTYLRTWDNMLTQCEQGKADHPIFVALRETMKTYDLPAVWLHDLLRAFSMDCTVRRYETYSDLLEYCRYSANPVGRLILTLFGYRDEKLYALSDAVCTGLQLANHWQDVGVDLKKDRIYLPQEDIKRFSARVAPPVSPAFQKLLAFEVERARDLFVKGAALPDLVSGRLSWELRLTWGGGVRILDKIKHVQYDVFTQRPVLTKRDWFSIGLRTLL